MSDDNAEIIFNNNFLDENINLEEIRKIYRKKNLIINI